MEKITVTSTVNEIVVVSLPDIRFRGNWPQKGSKVKVDEDILQTMMYDEGCRYMLEQGILYIDDMEVKKRIGLEPDDAVEPVNIILLSDDEKRRYLTVLPFVEFKNKVKKLSREQLIDLCDFSVQNRLIDIDKVEFLKNLTNIDILKKIELGNDKDE